MAQELDAILRPRSVAVVGASRRRGSIGWYLVHNLVTGDFQGKVFPVNPHAETIHSIKCYGRVLDIPDPVDLAVVAVPKEAVPEVVDQCGRKGVKGLVIITAGFRETADGGERERALLAQVRRYGLRLVGPNCMGVINTDPQVRLNATFAPTPPVPGPVAFMSQSGALGAALLDLAVQYDLGLSAFVSLGNKADVNANDCLAYWLEDPRTKVVALYLESFGDPRRFKELARRATRKKPVVLVKAGRTEAGAAAAVSHTGALAGPDLAVTALTEQAGVVRVTSVEELFDVLRALVRCPLPQGPRVAVVTNAGGPAIMATDALVHLGLELAPLGEATRRELARFLPPEASLRNPVDMLAGATPKDYDRALELVPRDPAVDALMVIFVPPLMVDPEAVMGVITERARRLAKPLVGVVQAPLTWHTGLEARFPGHPPVYRFPDGAARALQALWTCARRRRRPVGRILPVEADAEAVGRLLDPGAADPEGWVRPDRAFRVLEHYGIPTARTAFVRDPEAAVRAARRIGYPVALKAVGPRLVHKSDVGAVRLDLRGDDALAAAVKAMGAALGRAEHAAAGFLVQEMVPGEREVLMGMEVDPAYGPMLLFGMGGKYVEVLRDVYLRLAPITDEDARAMVTRIRGYPLLEGVRGEPPSRIDLLVEALQRLSALVTRHPEIRSMEVNPFMAGSTAETCKAVDVRIRVRRVGGEG